MPAMVENWRSSGVATAAAIVSGLAPGSDAETWIVGKSTFGRSLMGSPRKAPMPKRTIPIMIRVVMTGRWMNRSENPIDGPPYSGFDSGRTTFAPGQAAVDHPSQPFRPVEHPGRPIRRPGLPDRHRPGFTVWSDLTT
jgi:hypothetical protein